MLGVCSIMGLPWFVAATVLSITHVNSLKLESECSAPGDPDLLDSGIPPGGPVVKTPCFQCRGCGFERHPQLSLATRGEDWASQGQPKGKAEIPAATREKPCRHNTKGHCHPRASSAKTRGFHTQLDEGPETP